MSANERRASFEAMDGVLQVTMPDRGGADNERAIGDGFGDGGEFFGAGEYGCGADGGASAFESDVVGIDDAEMKKSEVAHGSGGSADVKRVAGVDEDDAEAVEFWGSEQDGLFYGSGGFATSGAKARLILEASTRR
jgi:hypothetical protein